MIYLKIRCPICKQLYKNEDMVFMNVLNTIIHTQCYRASPFSIIDNGQFDEILKRYSFFQSNEYSK